MGLISIVPVNGLDADLLERLALCLEERFLFAVHVERAVRVPRAVLNSVRKQMFASTLIARVADSGIASDAVRLAITDYDLYKTSHHFVFGDASEDQRIALVSLFRLRNEFYGERADTNALFQRTLKESTHALGHALGLRHCSTTRCAMQFSTSIYDTDNKLSHFCEGCEKRMRARR